MKILTHCPNCHGELVVKKICCPDCGLELSNDFEMSGFDKLKDEEMKFLVAFLKARGNLKSLQEENGISYPTAKKRLEQLLISLGLSKGTEFEKTNIDLTNQEENDMFFAGKKVNEKNEAVRVSEVIRSKLIEENGSALIHTLNGKTHNIYLTKDGNGFFSPALPDDSYKFEIFDMIAGLIEREGGRARKGMARGSNDKVGTKNCNEHTVTGVIALDYYGKEEGESVFDPVFVLAAVMEWAGIVNNCRGYIEFTANYKMMKK